ncbi:Transposon Tf2-8 polyprotein, partial [Araneus ventricosus]
MPNPKDKNVETVDSSSNTENTLAEVVEQYTNTDVPIEKTNLSDTHIFPFDSENGINMELWLQYFNET